MLTSREKGEQLEQRSKRVIAAELGVESRVIVRTARELAAVVERNPLGASPTTQALPGLLPLRQARPGGQEAARGRGRRPRARRRPRPRDLCLAPRRHPALAAGQAAHRREARRHRDRAQLEHGHEAARPGAAVAPSAAKPSRRWPTAAPSRARAAPSRSRPRGPRTSAPRRARPSAGRPSAGPCGRRRADRGRERREPLAHRRGLVVDDVVDLAGGPRSSAASVAAAASRCG